MTVLDKFLKDKRSELSKLKKIRSKLKGSEKHNMQEPIQKLEALIRRFRKSNMEPRQVGNIVINFKLYTRSIKKLKGFETKLTITDEMVLLQYGKNFNNYTGKLELYDLSKHFEGYGDIPKAEILNE